MTELRVSTPRLVFGFAVLAAGVLLTLDRLGMVDARDYLVFWPLLVIALGLPKLLRPQTAERLVGMALVLIGLWLQLYFLGWVDAWPGDYFAPAILVLLGIVLVLGGLRRREIDADSESWISSFAIWSGVERGCDAEDFRGADLTAIMGGIELDLRRAKIPSGRAVVHVFTLWGGIDLKVPPDWRIEIPVFALLGGYSDDTEQTTRPDSPVLVIKGAAIMAGLGIKN